MYKFITPAESSFNQLFIDFYSACLNGDYIAAKEIYFSKTIDNSFSPNSLNALLGNSCNTNNIILVDFLLTQINLYDDIDIHFLDDFALQRAALAGNWEIVKYLLTSPSLKQHANIHCANELVFTSIAETEVIEHIDYLLNSSELQQHSNPYCLSSFQHLCFKRKYKALEYLIYEQDYPLSEPVNSFIVKHKMDAIQKMFAKRYLNQSLMADLTITTKKPGIHKI